MDELAKKGQSPSREIVGGIVGGSIGFLLMRLGQGRIAQMASETGPGLGTTRRVDETPMMQILIWLGVAMILVGIVYAFRGIAGALRKS
jgi:hypothetical protein